MPARYTLSDLQNYVETKGTPVAGYIFSSNIDRELLKDVELDTVTFPGKTFISSDNLNQYVSKFSEIHPDPDAVITSDEEDEVEEDEIEDNTSHDGDHQFGSGQNPEPMVNPVQEEDMNQSSDQNSVDQQNPEVTQELKNETHDSEDNSAHDNKPT